MMISAKTPTAAKIAPMMIFVGFVSLVVGAGGVDGVVDVRKVNWPTKDHQHALLTIGRVAAHSIDVKANPCIDYTDRVRFIRKVTQMKELLPEGLGP